MGLRSVMDEPSLPATPPPTAPDFGAGDPSVSARAAALGDTILPGEDRWYFVYYLDPNVLGGCPATSTFNATQTGRVLWVQ